MSENIGKFFAPNGTATLEVDNDNFRCSSSLNFPVGGINYLYSDDYQALVLSSGQTTPGNTTYKPEVILFPNSSPDSHYNNKVLLRVYDNGSSNGAITTLTLGDSEYGAKINGKSITTNEYVNQSVFPIDQTISKFVLPSNTYKLNNGLMIIQEYIEFVGPMTKNTDKIITFPSAFCTYPSIDISVRSSNYVNIAIPDIKVSSMTVRVDIDISEFLIIRYVAIGRWK